MEITPLDLPIPNLTFASASAVDQIISGIFTAIITLRAVLGLLVEEDVAGLSIQSPPSTLFRSLTSSI
ncbi:hypothetical protein AGABI2DRAFT_189196 [Agaricus bisporus var. bisporus H97]|uniref:hypothetical protein n=1 Tax=Agaricus bisporus var. bisporus (strain H97 / ATCC MYA-4626 / FGSC 10389) TaxID=936046 RepID=UPI00029F5FD1|nr:hypothetical protein AGABI2DRAFT_189196 [Agaricus bisporus var. bisporus H97]EKV50851.1 hypothetical protein AGABI2DRAFT_189196 [Agaricus bisporus var. bisporus H97]